MSPVDAVVPMNADDVRSATDSEVGGDVGELVAGAVASDATKTVAVVEPSEADCEEDGVVSDRDHVADCAAVAITATTLSDCVLTDSGCVA